MLAAERAHRVLRGPALDVEPSEPFAACIVCARADSSTLAADAEPLLSAWESAHPGSQLGELRYRWPLTHRQVSVPDYAGSPWDWRPWRAADAKRKLDPFALEAMISVPLVVAQCGELLCSLARSTAPVAQRARRLLQECEPIMRRDFAAHVQATRPFDDSFALWVLMEHPQMLSRLYPIAIALASTYAANARPDDGIVRGRGFPFHGQPLTSATAHLGRALCTLGLDLDLLPRQLAWLQTQRQSDGGYQDANGPSDLLTTLVATDLLLHLSPDFDPEPTLEYLRTTQRDSGMFCALGPEAPWLTARVAALLEATALPFGERFRWPLPPDSSLDRKTGLPFFALFDQLAQMFAAVPDLSRAHCELAFIDLAGFRDFNNRFGQDTGDQVLRVFAGALPDSFAIRDGGDEFLVLGAPAASGLQHPIAALQKRWPEHFATHFGADVPPVAPRILIAETRCGDLSRAREELGRALSPLKQRSAAPQPEGVLQHLGRLSR